MQQRAVLEVDEVGRGQDLEESHGEVDAVQHALHNAVGAGDHLRVQGRADGEPRDHGVEHEAGLLVLDEVPARPLGRDFSRGVHGARFVGCVGLGPGIRDDAVGLRVPGGRILGAGFGNGGHDGLAGRGHDALHRGRLGRRAEDVVQHVQRRCDHLVRVRAKAHLGCSVHYACAPLQCFV